MGWPTFIHNLLKGDLIKFAKHWGLQFDESKIAVKDLWSLLKAHAASTLKTEADVPDDIDKSDLNVLRARTASPTGKTNPPIKIQSPGGTQAPTGVAQTQSATQSPNQTGGSLSQTQTPGNPDPIDRLCAMFSQFVATVTPIMTNLLATTSSNIPTPPTTFIDRDRRIKNIEEECARQKVEFSGLPGTNVNKFLHQLEEIFKIYNPHDSELCRILHALLIGSAKVHLKENPTKYETWKDAKDTLKKIFQSETYDVESKVELLQRKQLPKEPMAEFIEAVKLLNKGLIKPVADDEVIQISEFLTREKPLTPLFAFMIVSVLTIFEYMGNGPLWNHYSTPYIDNCKDNWHWNLLYLQNYVSQKHPCLDSSWYLSADMQLFWLAPFILYPMLLLPARISGGFILAVILIWAGLTARLDYVNKVSPNLFIRPSQMKEEYIHTHTRAGPWLVGVALGFIIVGIKANKIKIKLSKVKVALGWIGSTALCLGVLYGIIPFLAVPPTQSQAAMTTYMVLHRLGWSLGLSWVIFACVTGYGGLVKTFLSWGIFQILGKLSYCAFLIHSPIRQFRMGKLQTNVYLGEVDMGYNFLGDYMLSNLLSIPIVLLIEIPIANLDRYFFRDIEIFRYPSQKRDLKLTTKKKDLKLTTKKKEEESLIENNISNGKYVV